MPSLPTVIDATPDREAQAALRDITARIQALKGRAAAVLFELGGLLRRVEDEALWQAGGYASFSDYLERGVDLSRRSARRAVEVTRHFGLDVAERYGFDKLDRGLRYVAVTRKVERPGDLIAADLRLRGANGQFFTVPFHEATSRQVDDATALVLALRDGATRKPPPDLTARVARLNDTLPPPAAGARSRRPRVEVKTNAQGEVSYTFRDIPGADLRAALKAMADALLDEA